MNVASPIATRLPMDHSIGIDQGIKASDQVERASINRDVDKTSSENEVAHESDKLLPPVAPEDSESTQISENDLPPIKEPPDKSSKPPQRRLSTVSDIFDSSVSS